MNKVLDKIKSAPEKPGVYIFKNRSGKPIYIGRSVNLKERLGSYPVSPDPKTKALLEESFSLEIVETETVIESVVKEVNLIKRHKPKYNVKEKDDRSFVYIEMAGSDWPYPRLRRERLLDEDSFRLGPFKSLKTARDLLLLTRKIFPFSTCKEGSGKPCFHRQISLCPGKCTGEISKKEYRKMMNDLLLFLKDDQKNLKKSAPERVELLKMIDDSLLISRDEAFSEEPRFPRIEGYDITHFGGKDQIGAMVLFRDGDFDKNGYRIFKIRGGSVGDDIASLSEVLERRLARKEWEYPDLFLVDGGTGQVKTFESILLKNEIDIPVIGISKYGGDRVVSSQTIDIDPDLFQTLRKVRDEAHRFANSFRKKAMSRRLVD